MAGDTFSLKKLIGERSALRKKIIKKQKNRCSCCGSIFPDHLLQIAHIKDKAAYKNKDNSFYLKNLEGLCPTCHKNFDDYKKFFQRKYGVELHKWSDYNALLKKLKKKHRGKKSTTKRPTKKPTRTTKRTTKGEKGMNWKLFGE